MGKRRKARELAVQFLYQIDIIGTKEWSRLLKNFWKEYEVSPEVKGYSDRLIELVVEKQPHIDQFIAQYTTNWDITRIAVVDRNVLRVAICELLYMEDIPPIVSINEAVDVAKKYGSVDSGKFVNGILDKIRIELIKKSNIKN